MYRRRRRSRHGPKRGNTSGRMRRPRGGSRRVREISHLRFDPQRGRVEQPFRRRRSSSVLMSIPLACPPGPSAMPGASQIVTSDDLPLVARFDDLVPVFAGEGDPVSSGSDMPNHRSVRASSPRARRASALLPASRAAFRATARSIGLPFQCVISVPTFSVGSVFAGDTHDTRCLRSSFS
jgi:hypothetical protein